MKKIFILLLVFGLSQLAGAEIMISLDGVTGIDEYIMAPSDTVTIGMYNAGGTTPIDFLAYLTFYYPAESGYSLSNLRLGPAGGNFPDGSAGWIGPYLYEDYEEIFFTQAWWPSPEVEPVGDMFLVDFQLVAAVDVTIELWDWRDPEEPADMILVDTLAIRIIPEPATLLLLGLGGLLLRKKK